ncbi:hypothetical protein RF11_12192 [Thelohanellus kitauei]|uniref:Uncharacterized protein n=1 Tax=Thelohanellus kitauei TaxID=669202 RepID=A0A0C2M7L1_THEKT|nr:hypothetical protein RF11_12192 [Thelohanellus kitauei]
MPLRYATLEGRGNRGKCLDNNTRVHSQNATLSGQSHVDSVSTAVDVKLVQKYIGACFNTSKTDGKNIIFLFPSQISNITHTAHLKLISISETILFFKLSDIKVNEFIYKASLSGAGHKNEVLDDFDADYLNRVPQTHAHARIYSRTNQDSTFSAKEPNMNRKMEGTRSRKEIPKDLILRLRDYNQIILLDRDGFFIQRMPSIRQEFDKLPFSKYRGGTTAMDGRQTWQVCFARARLELC